MGAVWTVAFECPHAGCRKPFSVNSNMRRHYRTHSSDLLQDGQNDGVATSKDEYIGEELMPTDMNHVRSPRTPSLSSEYEDVDSNSESEVQAWLEGIAALRDEAHADGLET